MRHIALVSGTLGSGGAERQFAGMANYWAQAGERVTLTTWSGTEVPDFYTLDPRVVRVRFAIALASSRWQSPLVHLRRILALRRWLRAHRPDTVVSFITETNLLTLVASAGLGLRVVVSDRVHPAADATVSPPWRLMRRLLYRFADLVVAQTTQARDWTREHCRRDAVVIPNALRTFIPQRLPRESLVVGIGRLDVQKGFDVLLRAFARIAARFPGWQVAIVGDGPQREQLLALRDSLALRERVQFPGSQRDVESWLARAGLVVQPSRFEGFPNVILEAMAAGAAVVSSDCLAGPSDLIRDGVDGRLARVDDVEGFAAIMAELLASPEERARLGSAAEGVRERYRLESIMNQWNVALESVA